MGALAKSQEASCRSNRFPSVVVIGANNLGQLTRGGQTHRGDNSMRVMVIVKANKESEAGVLPDEEILTKMGKYNEELVKAGIMLAGEGLQPTSKGKRVRFSGATRTVIDGPFTETKELIAGFWL